MKFVAFISYRQVEPDRGWAKWLHAALESYRVPRRLARGRNLPGRLGRVFRDESELAASPDLSAHIREALEASEFLIVVCSPRTPSSRWVDAEIEHFRALGRSDRILVLLAEGEPRDAFPPSLCGDPAVDREPLAADIRPSSADSPRGRRRDAKLRLIATILGCRFDELRQREQERRVRQMAWLSGVLAVVLTLICGLAIWAEFNRRTAVTQRDRALRNQSLFLADLANQESARGDATLGVLLALEALPANPERPDRPYVPEAEAALYQSLHARRELAVVDGIGVIATAMFSPQGDQMLLIGADGRLHAWKAVHGSKPAFVDQRVKSAFFVADGSRFVAVSEGGPARLWDAATNAVVAILGNSPVRQAAVDSRGNRILTVPDAGAPGLWDARSGEALAVLGSATCWSSAFSPDGSRLATGLADGSVRLWDVATGRQLAAYQNGQPAFQCAFSRDGRRILTSAMNEACLWDTDTGEILLRDRNGPIFPQAFLSPDGDRMLCASMTGSIRAWKSGSEPPVGFGRQWQVIHRLTASADRRRIVSASNGGDTCLWNSETGKLLAVLNPQTLVREVVFSPAGDRLVTTGGGSRLWDAGSGTEIAILRHDAPAIGASVVFGPLGSTDAAEFSADGSRVVTCSPDGTARVWNARDGTPEAVLRGHGGPVRGAVISPDGSRVFTRSDDGSGRLWNLADTAEVVSIATPDSPVRAMVLSPRGDRLATISENGGIRIWPGDRGGAPTIPAGSAAPFHQAEFNRDGTRLVAAARDGLVRVWNPAVGSEIASFTGHGKSVRSARFSPDGSRVLTCSEDRTARVWETVTGREVFRLDHEGEISKAIFSPDGKRIATLAMGLSDKPGVYVPTAVLWDAESGRRVATMRETDSDLYAIVFSPEGALLVTAGQNGMYRLWSAATGEKLHDLAAHADSVLDPEFSPDGRLILTAAYDGVARLWSVATGKMTAAFRQENGVRQAAFSPDGLRVFVISGGEEPPRLWDAASGNEVAVFGGPEQAVSGAWFGPDNRRLFSHSDIDGSVRMWNRESGQLRALLCRGRIRQILPCADSSGVWILDDAGLVRRFPVFRGSRELIDHARAVVPRRLSPQDRKRCFLESGDAAD